MEKKPEILAPCGSYEALLAAVRCGADAVYLGAKNFNARRNAQNFSPEELEAAVRYCHAYSVKVYLALNTLLFDSELPEAVESLRWACEHAIDAIIVQDMGLVYLARQMAPQLALHASTQMSVHNLEGARFLEEQGFTRVVAAREMSLTELRRLTQGTSLEVEVFVHGALCMSVSGQCYFSSLLGERSGNRGLCAQTCRLPFETPDRSCTHALSLKDLSLIGRLDELTEIGVASLKIEGRMKRPEYVAAAVTACKDSLAGRPVQTETLQSVFSRSGFTQGYLDGRVDRGMFGTRQKEDVTAAAGVLGELSNLYHKDIPRVPVLMQCNIQKGQPIVLSVRDEEQNHVTCEGEPPQTANFKPTDREMVEKSLGKTGGTPFLLNSLSLQLDDGLAVPISALNALRRQALETLQQIRENRPSFPVFSPPSLHFPKHLDRKIPTLRGHFNNIRVLTQDMVDDLELLILPLDEVFNSFNNPLLKTRKKVVLELPRAIFHNFPKICEQLAFLRQQGFDKAYCSNVGTLWAAKQQGFSLYGGFGLNVTNSLALKEYAQYGLKDLTVSFELNLGQIQKLGDLMPYGMLAYGRLPLMLLRNCPLRSFLGCQRCNGSQALTDRRGIQFPLLCQDDCAQLFNSQPLYLADRLRELEGVRFLELYFTTETPEAIVEIIEFYKKGGTKLENITRGLYYRNVK